MMPACWLSLAAAVPAAPAIRRRVCRRSGHRLGTAAVAGFKFSDPKFRAWCRRLEAAAIATRNKPAAESVLTLSDAAEGAASARPCAGWQLGRDCHPGMSRYQFRLRACGSGLARVSESGPLAGGSSA